MQGDFLQRVKPVRRSHAKFHAYLFAACLASAGSLQGQVSLGSAVDLALRSSDQVQAAEADQAKALAALSQSKDAYIPAVGFSTGAAKGTGFPLGDPSLVKFTAQGLLFNSSQPQYVHAAREALRASQFALDNVRQQVTLDAALSYTELATDEQSVAVLREEESAAGDMVRIMQDRSDAGLESRLALRKAQLRAAQARLKRLDLEARADVLRSHLAALTGIPRSTVHTKPEPLPPFPAMLSMEDAERLSEDSNAAVKSAFEMAKSKQFVAKGEHRVNFRPEIDLIAQYGYINDFNDYSRFYVRQLPANNAVGGVQIQVPLFNRVQSAKAHQADADAAKALHEANMQRSLASEQLVQLQRSVEQTEAAADIARIQHEISADNLEALRLREQQSGDANTPSVSPADTAGATVEERALLADSLSAEFQHTQAELEFMRAVGTLSDWARAALSGNPATTPH